jgi:hypothetical protein
VDLYRLEVERNLAGHVAPVFEALCRTWVRRNRGTRASRVASWWGPATAPGRANGRQTEEIDIVGMGRSRATIIGECKWTSKPLSVSILAALNDHKIPALRQNGVNVAAEPEIFLFSRAGFTDGLKAAAAIDANLTLVDPSRLVAGI